MKRIIYALLSLTLGMGACSTNLPPTDTVPGAPASPPYVATELTPESFPDSPTIPIPKFDSTLQTPHIDQPPNGNEATITPIYEGCAYQWAQKALPELSGEFQQAIQELQPEALANAYAFGEDCIYADGHAVFSAMETDFNITLQVSELSNEAELGEWIVKVMQMVESIPPEKIEGSRPGRVSLEFRSGSEQKFVNFYIDQYQALPDGLSTTEIYRTLQTPQ